MLRLACYMNGRIAGVMPALRLLAAATVALCLAALPLAAQKPATPSDDALIIYSSGTTRESLHPTNSASGLASRTFCSTGAKSGLRNGVRSLSATKPPLRVKRSTKYFSASMPGP